MLGVSAVWIVAMSSLIAIKFCIPASSSVRTVATMSVAMWSLFSLRSTSGGFSIIGLRVSFACSACAAAACGYGDVVFKLISMEWINDLGPKY